MHKLRFSVNGISEKDFRRNRNLFQSSPFTAAVITITGPFLTLYTFKLIFIALAILFLETPVAYAPISSIVPKTFIQTGGGFRLSVSPLDVDEKLITTGLDVRNFSFSNISAADPEEPNTILSMGSAFPESIEIIPTTNADKLKVIMLLDSSGSMRNNDPSRQRVTAGKQLIHHLFKNESASVEFAVMDFERLIHPFTTDANLLTNAIEQVGENTRTPLFDKLKEAIDLLSNAKSTNRVLIVLTDGEDTASSTGLTEVVEEAKRSNTFIVLIGLGKDMYFSDMEKLALETGGSFARVEKAEALASFFDILGVSVSEGRVVVNAWGKLDKPIDREKVVISGNLNTRLGGNSISSHFRFFANIE